ncbi:MAG: guanylate kinase [Bdellovibrionaceae bacterium]|nr:guanylate kinase [Pseudobdellovibrionaceae bacterium]
MKTRMIIVAAPSGAGKSSFVERACREDSRLEDTVTFTTRAMRKGESQGHPYHFVTREEFEIRIKENFFVEWANVHNNLYGTPYYQLEDAWLIGKCVIMDVDVQGADTFKAKYPNAVSIFILPPSIDELRRRIEKRDGRVPADIEIRMSNAQKEIQVASKFDYQIVNDQFDLSYGQFKKIIEELLA